MPRIKALWLTLLSGVLWLGTVSAIERLEPTEVPAPLQPWVDWVLAAHPDRDCPLLADRGSERRCAWPAAVALELEPDGGRFRAEWQVFAESWIALPGNAESWPQQVMVNDKARAVVEHDARPSLRLAPGTYTISGRFGWPRLPEFVAVPLDSGLVSLSVNGAAVAAPDIDAEGRIWLGGRSRSTSAASQENRLGLTVMRRLVDDSPMELYTRIEFDVTGEAREQLVGTPLPDGFIAVDLEGPLPARLDANGMLTVQLRPGRHVLVVRARHPQWTTRVTNPAQAAPWPDQEVWTFEARSDIRVVELGGVPAVDARQTRLPAEWAHLPAYALAAGASLELTVTRRGNPDPEPDKLNLYRTLWLDFDGSGYTTRDQIGGQITRQWRLDSSPALQLGQVLIDSSPQLITRSEDGEREGVEVRRGDVEVQAEGRMLTSISDFAISGWAHDFHSVRASLHLPPGWDVFSVGGVDNVPDTWMSRWTLLDLFMVLVIATAVARLWNWRAGAVALVTLVLIWHAPGAPRYVWLHLLLAIALLRVLPAGRIARLVGAWRNLTVLALLLVSVAFVMQQLRGAIYPQLESPPPHVMPMSAALPNEERAPPAMMADAAMDMAPAYELEMPDDLPDDAVQSLGRAGAAKKNLRAPLSAPPVAPSANLYGLDPDAIVQTGPGLPTWQWRELELGWNGPVARGQTLNIRYLSPLTNRALKVARVAFLLALLLIVAGHWRRRVTSAPRGTMVSAVLLSLAVLSPPPAAQAAAFPDPTLLTELQQRLIADPECAPHCAEIPRMTLTVAAETVSVRLEVHAATASAIPLPGNRASWVPDTVLLNAAPAPALARDSAGTLWLPITAGVHQVVLRGRLPDRRRVQIALPLRPQQTSAEIDPAWRLDGLRERGQVEAQLQLTRRAEDAASTPQARFDKTQLPPFVRIERTIDLGLDWTVTTRVFRVVAGDNAVVLAVPLLKGESVVTPGFEIADGAVKVNLPSQRAALSWQSVLPPSTAIELNAAPGSAWSETWRLRSGPIWHVELSGLAPVQHRGDDRRWLPEWRPWPGESVHIAISRPPAVDGQTLTIDSSTLSVQPGKRATETTLEVRLRSSKGGQYSVAIPPRAALQEIRLNGRALTVRAEQGRLNIPIAPGAQDLWIGWREDTGVTNSLRTPSVDLGAPSINHHIRLILGDDRWTLFAFGPQLGPAVLFWSLLAGLLVVAAALSRLPLTPLRLHEWLLLAIGLSQLPLPMAAIVVLWLLALGARQRHGAQLTHYRFNLMQIALTALSIAALAILVEAIRHGLLGHPDMHVAGNGSSAHNLLWYADRIAAQPPTALAVSVPLLVYRLLMLGWALWLALAVVRWLRWGWSCFAHDGLWQAWRRSADATTVT